jgi:hypothetical protein|tara:strand:- start:76 stop:798 length:723 start_codon:yes stop_codon:yes gene_type:complete
MNKLLTFFVIIFTMSELYAQDNEIYVSQVGATANIDLEQMGSSNMIGGLNSTAGSMTDLDLDGATMTLDVNQIGDSNKFLGDILADSFTGFFEFDGDSNDMTIQVDPTNTYGADSSNLNVDVTGSSNDFTIDLATAAIASNTDMDWIVMGDSNTINADIDIDQSTNYMDIDGDSNTINYDGDGATASAGGYFYLEHDGNTRSFDIEQQSQLDSDWLKVTSSGNNGTVCIQQNDAGTSTSC